MSWFIFAALATLGWGFADMFYKKSSENNDNYSHLKTAVWVGLIMGLVSVFLLITNGETDFSPLLINAIKYTPASLSYIISMIIGYAGLRYLELSVISPVQNASGAFSCIAMVIWFALCGKITNITDEFSLLDIIGTAIIIAGVVLLAVAEKRENTAKTSDKKYTSGALALIFPLTYCLFDTIGTAADGIILDEDTGLGLSETDVLILYGLTFLVAGIISFAYISIKTKKLYNPFAKSEMPKCVAAVCEETGQIFYVYAMAANPVLSAPLVASYCIISVILSRIFLHEKLKKMQYSAVFIVIAGIVLLGISEGISEV